jgi:hypothetical protein
MEDHGRQQEADTFRSTINCPCQSASLAAEMKVEIQPQQMLKDIPRNPADCFLSHTGEDSVAKLLKYGSPDSGSSV